MVVSLLRLKEAGGRTGIGVLVDVDADVVVVADVLLLLVVTPVLPGGVDAVEGLLTAVRAAVEVLLRMGVAGRLTRFSRLDFGHAEAEGVLFAHHR